MNAWKGPVRIANMTKFVRTDILTHINEMMSENDKVCKIFVRTALFPKTLYVV